MTVNVVRFAILYIGDVDNQMAELLGNLEREASLVRTCNHKSQALEFLAADPIDLVLLNFHQNRQDANDLIQSLRSRYVPTRLPILLFCGKEQEKDLPGLIALGANDVMFLPFDLQLAKAKILRTLDTFKLFQTVERNRKRYQLAAEGSGDGLWDWELEDNYVFFSDQWRNMFGVSEDQDIHHPDDWFDRVHPDDMTTLRSKLAIHIEGITPKFECQVRMQKASGEYIWTLCRGIAIRDEHGRAVRMAGTMADLTDRSHHDSRTGLPFRTLFMDRLKQALVKCQLNSESSCFSILYIDIDRFKVISEGYGHNIVDALLIAFARRLEKCLGHGDTLAFFGGDTFVILLEDSRDMETASMVANQIHLQLIAPFLINETEVFTKASVGITRIHSGVKNAEEVLQEAQMAMKFARSQQGSGHTEIFNDSMASQSREMMELEGRLRRALDEQEFILYYQPQIHVPTNRIIGVETLIRWNSPQHGWISPGKFIPVAEETDLILTIGEWVLRSACQQNMKWQKMGFNDLRVAVNLSERQFRARSLIRSVEHILQETGMDPGLLELELTESIFMDDISETIKTLESFQKMGIKIALDDFGTGYSSLSYLKKFPINTLKIDRAFVKDLITDPGDAAICSTIISLAHKFNLSVIAEGVEQPEQLTILRAFMCDEIQGHYYSKPLPAEELEQLLKRQLEAPPDTDFWKQQTVADFEI
jgi:diguanylate cyclase (GGDEF)-like protein/PAS domain S-box-containing protein